LFTSSATVVAIAITFMVERSLSWMHSRKREGFLMILGDGSDPAHRSLLNLTKIIREYKSQFRHSPKSLTISKIEYQALVKQIKVIAVPYKPEQSLKTRKLESGLVWFGVPVNCDEEIAIGTCTINGHYGDQHLYVPGGVPYERN
jgi:hypothetical protein